MKLTDEQINAIKEEYTKLYSAIHIENRIVFDININS